MRLACPCHAAEQAAKLEGVLRRALEERTNQTVLLSGFRGSGKVATVNYVLWKMDAERRRRDRARRRQWERTRARRRARDEARRERRREQRQRRREKREEEQRGGKRPKPRPRREGGRLQQ